MNPHIAITGFKPFSHFRVNSSWEGAKKAKSLNGHIHIQEITVEHMAAHNEIVQLLINTKCDILLLTGLADRTRFTLETLAFKPSELYSIDGPPVLKGNWPWNETITTLRNLNISADISEEAGKYVCESIYWSALNFKKSMGFPKYISFLHVPPLSKIWNEEKIAKVMLSTIKVAEKKFSTERSDSTLQKEA